MSEEYKKLEEELHKLNFIECKNIKYNYVCPTPFYFMGKTLPEDYPNGRIIGCVCELCKLEFNIKKLYDFIKEDIINKIELDENKNPIFNKETNDIEKTKYRTITRIKLCETCSQRLTDFNF